MTRRTLFPLAVAVAFLAVPGRARAQDAPKPEAPKADKTAERREPSVTLRVQLVVTRLLGEKKVASLPYTFVVATGGGRARMRMGVDTPIPMTTGTSDTGKPPNTFQYKTVGTNIDCSALDVGEGRYQLNIGVENSSALSGPGASVDGAPLFRRFETNLNPVLRDGQSLQTVAATDPVTGEVVKIDVSLSVVK